MKTEASILAAMALMGMRLHPINDRDPEPEPEAITSAPPEPQPPVLGSGNVPGSVRRRLLREARREVA